MKKQIIFWIFLLLGVSYPLFIGCKTMTEVVTVYQSCGCPAPRYNDVNGYYRPRVGYDRQAVSHDGKMLSYAINGFGATALQLLDLKTLQSTVIPLRQILPDTADWLEDNRIINSIWCPYDGNKIFIQCSGSYKQGGQYRGYIYNITTKGCIRIKPFNSPIKGEFQADSWLRGSNELIDSFRTGSAIYVPQKDKFYPNTYPTALFQSPYSNDDYSIVLDAGGTSSKSYINGDYIYQSPNILYISHVSFSPDRKKLVLTVDPAIPPENPEYMTQFPEVWVFDLAEYQGFTNVDQHIYRLNFQNLFCKYSFRDIDAEYITDSTLAVSMHKDGDAVSPLWEITDRGKVVRQLTK